MKKWSLPLNPGVKHLKFNFVKFSVTPSFLLLLSSSSSSSSIMESTSFLTSNIGLFCIFSVINLSLYILLRTVLGTDISRRSWLLTLFSSVTTTISGFYHLILLAGLGWTDPSLLHSTDLPSRATLVYFMSYLVLDLAVGVVDYPSKITLLAGWTHHFAYLGILSYLIHVESCIPFCLFLSEELPTAAFSIGFLAKQWRHDNLFGASYLALRLALHAYMSFNSWKYDIMGWQFAWAVMPLHIFWFSQWVQQQRREKRFQFLNWFDIFYLCL